MAQGTTTDHKLEAEEEHVEGLDGTGSDMARIIGMSDAVFAFSMTFLVVTLVLPQVAGVNKYSSLPAYLGSEWPSFVAYLISFFVIASWWGAHRRLFSPIVRYDGMLIRLNNLFLLVIAITPFLVDVLYFYGPGDTVGPGTISSRIAVALFAGVQVMGGLILLAIWRHSTRDLRLVEAHLPVGWIHRTEQNEIYNVSVFAASVVVAFVAPTLAMVLWVVAVIGLGHARRRRPRGRRRGRPSPSPGAGTAPPLS